MSKKVNIRPTTGVYSTYKRLNYKIHTAIAEFVDNSTQSYFDNRDKLLNTKYFKLEIDIKYEYTNNGDKLIITDNAYGMNFHDFQRALILDRPPKNTNGRNEFGMGLKTAASWFGNKWSVKTKELGSSIEYYAEIDIDILQKYKSEEIEVIETKCNPKEHYTIITIERLNQRLANDKSNTINKKIKDNIIKKLSSTYREDLRSGEMNIYFQGEPLEFIEPPILEEKLYNGDIRKWKKDISFFVEHNGNKLHVNGFVAIRIPASTSEAGFTLLRKKRVIIGGEDSNYRPIEIFGKSNSFVYQRLYGELNLDEWPVTQFKDSFAWENNGLEEKFKEVLFEHVKDYAKKAHEYRETETINNQEVNKKSISALAKSGVIKNVKSISATISSTDMDGLMISDEISEKEKDKDKDIVVIEDTNIDNKVELYEFEIAQDKYIRLHNVIKNENPFDRWLRVGEMKTDDGIDFYQLDLNIKHPFFKPYTNKNEFIQFLQIFSNALVISELLCEISSDRSSAGVREGLNEILGKMAIKKGESK